MKKKYKKYIKYGVIGFSIVAFLVIMIISGGFKFIINIGGSQTIIQPPITPYPKEIVKEYVSYWTTLDLSPNYICAGDRVTGSITSNIPNGACSIFMDTGAGYVLFMNVNLDASGRYSQTGVVSVVGTATFIAVCCDANRNCKLSNTDTLNSRICDSDGDGVNDEIDPDDDNDGFSDEEEIEHGTDPKDPYDYPMVDEEEMDCNTFCIGKGYLSGRGRFDSIGYCNSPEIPELIATMPNEYCCCMPSSQPQTYTCGTTGENCQAGTCPANYPYCLEVWTDLYTHACMCSDSDSGNGNIHPDWKPGAVNYHPTTEPECSANSDCGTNYFCYNGQCQPRCQDSSGVVRTNYLGAWYDACWDGCGTDRTCCANTYFYHQYGCNDKTCYYSYCKWVEGQRCSSFDPCLDPGGTNP